MRKAVIDVGSNSVLLVVAEHADGSWMPIHEDSAVTALGEGTKATGLLGESGMSATLVAVARFFELARQYGATQVEAFATMAARIATNTDEFVARADRQGMPIRVLSGEDEADLGFEAVAHDPLFNESDRLTIIDPGGHSTELVTASRRDGAWSIEFRRSFPVGTLGLRSNYFMQAGVSVAQTLSGIDYLDQEIGLAYRPQQVGTTVVLGASGTNLVCIRDRILEWDPARVHGSVLTYEDVSRAYGLLAPMTDDERAAVPGLESGRERTIHLGALILERFLFALRAESCRVSVKGWRHAMLDRLLT